MSSNRYLTNLGDVQGLSVVEHEALRPVCEQYPFRTHASYLKLIHWNDPDDPVRRIVIPSRDELVPWGKPDASNEAANTVAPSLQHKYKRTVLLLANDVCGGFCRFCFRKRLFNRATAEVARDFEPAFEYIRSHPEVTNVVVSGGDPFLLSTRRLEGTLGSLRAIRHVGIIRIGSKMPAFNPRRFLDDTEIIPMLSRYSTREKRLYVLVHFNHPRELTPEACLVLDLLIRSGIIVTNQTPIVRGVNDDPKVLSELFRKLSFLGVPPYYVFQCRPTEGNHPYVLPLVRALEIFEEAKREVSGLAKRARLVMSHESGKIQLLGVEGGRIFMRYHQSRDPEDDGRFFSLPCHEEAYWLDDLLEAPGELAPAGYHSYGPE